jgi:hypothetical protein
MIKHIRNFEILFILSSMMFCVRECFWGHKTERLYDFSENVFYDGELFPSRTITAKAVSHLYRSQETDTFHTFLIPLFFLLCFRKERTISCVI